jgi:cation-transporting ATPase E
VLSDRVRDNIQETLAAFRDEGVALKVISGDNLETVREIATSAGMVVSHAYTGDQLDEMSDGEFSEAVEKGNLFARIEPHTKRRIVHTLKANGHYVAMTGDGVNDVPALKEAHLAIVMNDGAQISKDIADIVLLNNALSTMPAALHEGKLVTQSILGTSKIFLVKNVYSLLFFVFAGFMAVPFPINPIQISWVTFGVINVPATLIAFRLVKPKYMRHFRRDVFDYVVTGGGIFTAALALLDGLVYVLSGQDIDSARATMMMLITLFGMLVYWNVHGVELFEPRTWGQHRFTFWSGLFLAWMTMVGGYVAPGILSFTPPSILAWVLTGVIFFAAALLMYWAMRTRAFANLLWKLTSPP